MEHCDQPEWGSGWVKDFYFIFILSYKQYNVHTNTRLLSSLPCCKGLFLGIPLTLFYCLKWDSIRCEPFYMQMSLVLIQLIYVQKKDFLYWDWAIIYWLGWVWRPYPGSFDLNWIFFYDDKSTNKNIEYDIT